MGLSDNGSGLILNLDSEQIVFRFDQRRATRTVESKWLNSKTLIRLLDDPVPILQKYEWINSQFIKTNEIILNNLE